MSEFDKLSTTVLESLCRSLNLPATGNRSKMIQSISQQILPYQRRRKRVRTTKRTISAEWAARAIWRWWRHLKNLRNVKYVNETDFLTMEPIVINRPFFLIEDTQHVYQFHPLSLAQWFVQEGNFHNPYTRTPLNIVEIKRLDKAIRRFDPTFLCLATEHARITLEQRRKREHEQTCRLLHEESMNLLQDILELTSNANASNNMDIILYRLCSVCLPRYYQTFQQLYLLDSAFATDSILHMCVVLERMVRDETIATSRERTFLLETTQHSLVTFCRQLLPVFSALIADRMEQINVDVVTR